MTEGPSTWTFESVITAAAASQKFNQGVVFSIDCRRKMAFQLTGFCIRRRSFKIRNHRFYAKELMGGGNADGETSKEWVNAFDFIVV